MDQRNPSLKANSDDCRSALFFGPDSEIMYVEWNGILFEWKLRAKEGPEWWLGEGYQV